MINIVPEHKAKRLPGLIEILSNKAHTKTRAKDIAESKSDRGEPLLIQVDERGKTRYLAAQITLVPGSRGSVTMPAD